MYLASGILEGKNNNRSYQSAWKIWCGWCSARGMDPLNTHLNALLEFLAHRFQQGKSYRSLNVYRSAISSTFPQINGIPVGQHPLIVRLMKGAFHLRPQSPRYAATWPVHKLVTLTALALACRCSELQTIEVPGILFNEQGVQIVLQGLTKTSNDINPFKQLTIGQLKKDPLLCPVATLKQYLLSTKRLRDTPPKEKKLFLSYVKPHKPVTTSTIGCWIVSVLTASGVGAQFRAHSTRSAPVYQAIRAGIPVDTIYKQQVGVQSLYYQKKAQVEPKNLTKAVLSSEYTS